MSFDDESLNDESVSDNSADPRLFSFINELDLDQDVKQRLSSYLRRLLIGNSEVYTTPIVKQHSPESILKDWDKVFNQNKSMINDPLYELEMSNREKFGPRSIAKSWEDRKPSLLDYFNTNSYSRNLNLDFIANSNNFRPLSKEKAISYLKNNTNSGLPFYAKKGKVKDKVLRDYDVLSTKDYPCILFTRTQEGGKTRNVWGYPIFDTLREAMYYFILLNYQRNKSWRAAIVNPDMVDQEITYIINKALKESMKILSVDFSAYDASLSPYLITKAFDYIKSLFQKSYHSEIDEIRNRFINIGIVTPSGVIKGAHGVPSGSTFTNEVDSICQYLISKQVDIDDKLKQIQGDDGVYASSSGNIDKLISTFESYGLNVNKDKSVISNRYCIYLQNLYHPDYRDPKSGVIGGVYPTYRAINRILFQERWSDFEDFGLEGKDYYSIRTISILENCKHHPLFEKLVKFIAAKDKYTLSYSKKGLNKYIDLTYQGSGAGGIIENQYGSKVKGLNSFETVKILNSIA